MTSFMKIDFNRHKGLKASISSLIEEKVSTILKKLNSLDHLSDFVKIITICLSTKFKGDEKKLRNEFVDIFDKNEELTDEFINWLKKEIPKHLEKHTAKNDSPKKESSENESPKKEKKGIMDRVKFPDRSKKSDGLKDKPEDQNGKKGKRSDRRKRNQKEFEDGFSDSDDYDYDSRSKIFNNKLTNRRNKESQKQSKI